MTQDRLMQIEMTLANQEKILEELSDVVARQAAAIDRLAQQNKMLTNALKQSDIKPLSEETPPPHY